ncbi:MAG: YveK family protein [Clostridia bacterium]
MTQEREELEIDLREVFYVLKRRILIILLTAFIFAAGSGVYNFFVATPIYEATSKLYILTQSTSITSLADIQVGSSLALDYVEMIQSRAVVEEVIDNLDLDMEYGGLRGMLTVENPTDTRILNISIQSENASLATEVANEFAEVAKKQISRIMQTDEPSLFESAHTPEAPIKPEKTKNIMIAFLFGAVLSSLVVIVMYVLNDSIRGQSDIERYLQLDTLAVIPLQEGSRRNKKRRVTKRRKK